MFNQKVIVKEYPEKIIFKGDGNFSSCSFRDDYYCPEKNCRITIPGKSALNHRMASFFMEKFLHLGIANYFIKPINMREHLIRSLDPMPFSVGIWNKPNHEFCQKFSLPSDYAFEKPIIEYFFTDENGKKSMVNQDYLFVLGWISAEELDDLESLVLKINDTLKGMCLAFNLDIGYLSLDFGRDALGMTENFILSSEIIPDYIDFMDMRKEIPLDKSLWTSMEPTDLAEIYQNLAQRFNLKFGERLSTIVDLEDYKGPLRSTS